MGEGIFIAILSFIGTLIGSLSGILINNKMVTFRLERLERKVDEHNNVVKRMYVVEEKVKVANHRIEDLEHKIEK